MAKFQSYKRRIDSALFRRAAHCDVFEVGSTPRFLFVFFGGSGVDEAAYLRNAESVLPTFTHMLEGLSDDLAGFVLVHICAPYDVPFCRFSAEPARAEVWNKHVSTELLAPWEGLPYFVGGFSGGVALAFHGLERAQRCFGGAGFGADAMPSDFTRPTHWRGKLRLYMAPQDLVCKYSSNHQIAEKLQSRSQADLINLRSGGHRLEDYASRDGLADAILVANRLATESYGTS